MIRLLLLVAAGLVPVQAAGFQVPRYRLTPGAKLWYAGESEAKSARGVSHSSRLREHWVLSDSGGVFRVLMRVVDQGYKTDTAGNRTDEPVETGWELFEMTPNGRLLRDQSTIDVDVSALFPPLPADSAAAASRWIWVDTSGFVRYTYSYWLDNKSLSDSLWLVDRTMSTPFDIVYGAPTGEARVVIDTRRGLPLRRESRSADITGRRATQGNTVLDSVTKFDAANLQPQLRDIISYFDVKKAYEEEGAKADPDDTTGAADKRALALLQKALQRTRDSTVVGLLKQDIKQQEQSSEYQLSQTKVGCSGGASRRRHGHFPTSMERSTRLRITGVRCSCSTGGTRAARGAFWQCRN